MTTSDVHQNKSHVLGPFGRHSQHRQLSVISDSSLVEHCDTCPQASCYVDLQVIRTTWAARYNTWLLTKTMPKGVVFLFFSFLFLPGPDTAEATALLVPAAKAF